MAYYAQPLASSEPGRAEQRITALLAQHRWEALGAEPLAGYPTLRFLAPGCSMPVIAAVLPPDGEAAAVFEHRAKALGGRVAYIGVSHSPEHPRLAYIVDRLGTLLTWMGFGREDSSFGLALIEPVDCDVEHQSSWPERLDPVSAASGKVVESRSP